MMSSALGQAFQLAFQIFLQQNGIPAPPENEASAEIAEMYHDDLVHYSKVKIFSRERVRGLKEIGELSNFQGMFISLNIVEGPIKKHGPLLVFSKKTLKINISLCVLRVIISFSKKVF